RPASRVELRAPMEGFLQDVAYDEGDRVSPGAVLARVRVPDLETRIAQKQAEIHETQAKLRLLQIGARAEEIAEQRQRVERAKGWRDLAQQDLGRTRKAFEADLDGLDKQIAARTAELDVAQDSYHRAQGLAARKVVSEEQL